MPSKKERTSTESEPQPAAALGQNEVTRLGECMYAIVRQLQGTSIPLPRVVREAAFFRQVQSSDQLPDLRSFGEGMRDLHVSQGGYEYQLTLPQGKLFWEALDSVVDLLSSGQRWREALQSSEFAGHSVRAITLEEIAQQIIDNAFADTCEEPPPIREQGARVQFARCLDPGCSDAYLIEGGIKERKGRDLDAKTAYERAMHKASEKLGFDAFIKTREDAKGLLFWAETETRSYMRARAALAYLLWRRLGHLSDAIGHFRALLHLNPNDNQGNRDALLCCLLESGDDEALASSLAQYRYYTDDTGHKEDIAGTEWHYTNAVYLFRIHRDAPGLEEATQALLQAFERNRYVPIFLLEPEGLPDLFELSGYAFGDPTEGVMYVVQALKGWKNTPGALAWLEENARCSMLYPMVDEIPPIHVVASYKAL